MSKQTALEWLFNQLLLKNPNILGYGDYLEQAKEMEKEQIENAYRIGSVNELTYGDNKAEQYYKQKYGGNK
jgi:hypothetical protein